MSDSEPEQSEASAEGTRGAWKCYGKKFTNYNVCKQNSFNWCKNKWWTNEWLTIFVIESKLDQKQRTCHKSKTACCVFVFGFIKW